jgi:hypothetical protein
LFSPSFFLVDGEEETSLLTFWEFALLEELLGVLSPIKGPPKFPLTFAVEADLVMLSEILSFPLKEPDNFSLLVMFEALFELAPEVNPGPCLKAGADPTLAFLFIIWFYLEISYIPSLFP